MSGAPSPHVPLTEPAAPAADAAPGDVVTIPGGASVSRGHMGLLQLAAAFHKRIGRLTSLQRLAEGYGFAENRDEPGLRRSSAPQPVLRAQIPPASYRRARLHLLGLEEGTLRVAAAGGWAESDLQALANAALQAGFDVRRVRPEIWDRVQLERAIEQHRAVTPEQFADRIALLEADPKNAEAQRELCDDILADAMEHQASDIHLAIKAEPADDRCVITYQVFGATLHRFLLQRPAMRAVVNRFKMLANCPQYSVEDIIQDGRFSFAFQGRHIDVRLNATPAQPQGESVTMRLLDRATLKGFATIFAGMPAIGQRLDAILNAPVKTGDVVLVSGPNGQGKTSTLCAVISRAPRERKRIIVIEQPTEFDLPWCEQWQADPERPGHDFPDYIRASLRQAPHMVVVGELRDRASALAALQVPQTGITLLATVHADTAIQTVERVLGMMGRDYLEASGAFILANSLSTIVNQRLLPTVCPNCYGTRAARTLPEALRAALRLPVTATVSTVTPGGCPACRHTGIGGQTLVAETLLVTGGPAARAALHEHFVGGRLAAIGAIKGVEHRPMLDSARGAVLRGLVDPHLSLSALKGAAIP